MEENLSRIDFTSTPPLHCFTAPFFMVTGTVQWSLLISDGKDTAGIFSCTSNNPVHMCQAVLVVVVVGC